jgi:hypothetical protein
MPLAHGIRPTESSLLIAVGWREYDSRQKIPAMIPTALLSRIELYGILRTVILISCRKTPNDNLIRHRLVMRALPFRRVK